VKFLDGRPERREGTQSQQPFIDASRARTMARIRDLDMFSFCGVEKERDLVSLSY